MKEKIKRNKAFIQIPLLMIIIVSIIVASVGAGIVLHKQGGLSPLFASVAQIFRGAKDAKPEIKFEEPQTEEKQSLAETNQEEGSPIEQKLEQAKLKAERAKQETERLKAEREAQKLAEEQKQREKEEIIKQQELKKQRQIEEQSRETIQKSLTYRKNILDSVTLIIGEYKQQISYIDKLLQLIDNRINLLNRAINQDKLLYLDNPNVSNDVKDVVKVFDQGFEFDLKTERSSRNYFAGLKSNFEKIIKLLNNISNATNANMITKEAYVKIITTLRGFIIKPETVEDISKAVNQYAQYIKESDQQYKDLLNTVQQAIQQKYDSTHSEMPQTYGIEPYNFSSPYDSIMNSYYKQEQIRSLNRIAERLEDIWNELAH